LIDYANYLILQFTDIKKLHGVYKTQLLMECYRCSLTQLPINVFA